MSANTPSKRDLLRHLVTSRNQWDEPLTDEEKARGFLGWHDRGHLPHCDKPGLIQFVTIRLADSIPASRRAEWDLSEGTDSQEQRHLGLDAQLDLGCGACHLRDSRFAELTEQTLLHRHLADYQILAWCVMPNHLHFLVHIWDVPLCELVAGWKRFTATRALRRLRAEARDSSNDGAGVKSFWQREYWDTFMRDREHELATIRYIEFNPVKARLCEAPSQWRYGSARHRDEYQRLNLKVS